jgi:hypothetical protein
VVVDENVEGNAARFLLGKQSAVPFGELVEEFIPTIGDGGREVHAVRLFECQNCWAIARSQLPELGHCQIPATRCAGQAPLVPVIGIRLRAGGRLGSADAEACGHIEFDLAVWKYVLPEQWCQPAAVLGRE